MSSAAAQSQITLKQAVQSAIDYIRDFGNLFPQADTARLEETDFDEAPGEWRITISFKEQPIFDKRLYKEFRIDAMSGHVLSMKNRAVD